MEDQEIKSLLENVEVKPSARCWQAIESQLAASAGAAAATAAATAAASQSAVHTSWLFTTIGKVVLGIAAAAIATTAIVTAIVLNSPDGDNDTAILPNTTEVVPQNATPAIAEQTADGELSGFSLPAANATLLIPGNDVSGISNSDVYTPAGAEEQQLQLSQTVASSPASDTPSIPSANHQALEPASAVSAHLSTPANPVQSAASSASTVPVAQHQPVLVAQTDDPVVESLPESDYPALEEPIVLEIPNVITPNGDGYNDFFVIKGIEKCDKSRLIIRNHNGAIVLQVSDYQNNWDAPRLSEGTYFYQLFYTVRGMDEVRTGTLTIIR